MRQYVFKSTIILLIFLFQFNSLKSQTDSIPTKGNKNSVKPILLDKQALSGLGLKQIRLKDTPERKFYQKNLYKGKEISVYIVSSESWTVPFDKFWFDEFIYILNGKAKVESLSGIHEFNSGEYIFAPKGFKGKWEVDSGSNLLYELSVIANNRTDSAKVSKHEHPVLLDKTKLSGTTIEFDENGLFEETLIAGIELTIQLKAEKPRKKILEKEMKEQLICLLSGQLILEDDKGDEMIFYTGDYIVLPEGYNGKWESKGHGLIKYLTVEKT